MPAMRRRTGCLGCLGRLAAILVVGLIAGTVLLVAINWVFAPWAFYLGGEFHPMAVWQGTARIHASSGDYTLYLWLSPAARRRYNLPIMNGWGYLCTPAGERYSLRTTATISGHPGRETNGLEMRVDMHRRPWYWNLAGRWDERPRLAFRGRWQNPDFVANDGGTLSIAFLPNGRLYDGAPRNQPLARETLPVVFHSVPWTAWFSDCRSK